MSQSVRRQPTARSARAAPAGAHDKVRAAGVRAPESQILVERVEEVLSLDSATYRIRSHRFRCTFLIPYGGQTMRYSQDVTERTEGGFTGTITLPTGLG
ncbi:hypothetical protein ACWEWI_11725 [Streptomyces sp. NPDC003753]